MAWRWGGAWEPRRGARQAPRARRWGGACAASWGSAWRAGGRAGVLSWGALSWVELARRRGARRRAGWRLVEGSAWGASEAPRRILLPRARGCWGRGARAKPPAPPLCLGGVGEAPRFGDWTYPPPARETGRRKIILCFICKITPARPPLVSRVCFCQLRGGGALRPSLASLCGDC